MTKKVIKADKADEKTKELTGKEKKKRSVAEVRKAMYPSAKDEKDEM